MGVWKERPLPLLLLAGLVGGVDGGMEDVGRERPLPLPLYDERPPPQAPKCSKHGLSHVVDLPPALLHLPPH